MAQYPNFQMRKSANICKKGIFMPDEFADMLNLFQ